MIKRGQDPSLFKSSYKDIEEPENYKFIVDARIDFVNKNIQLREEDPFMFYWIAWQDLSTCRNNGMSLGVIPWTAINDYCHRWGIVDQDYEFFNRVIRSLDNVFLDFKNKEQDNDDKTSGRNNKPNKNKRR